MLLFALFIVGLGLAGPPSTGWEPVSDGEVAVSCTRAGAAPWCRATGTVNQVVTLPFPLENRDYVVHLTRVVEGSDHVITFTSVARPDIPVNGLRLPDFAGEFRVHPTAGGRTEFSYLWQADLGPDIPSWALPLAWRAQGEEIVTGLRAAAEGQAAR